MLQPAADAQKLFTNPANKDRLLQWHTQGMPFLQMADQLKLVIPGPMRDAIAGLSPAEVAIIRDAMVGALNANAAAMPVECSVTGLDGPVTVTSAIGAAGQPIAVIT
jgi:hypothetical protein